MRGVRDYWIIYYLVYVVAVIVLLALNWRNFTVESYVYLLAAIFGAALGTALFVAIVSEGIGYMVLLIPRRIKQLKDEGREEGREEGQRELQREWVAWNERRKAAERAGEPFDEPPPAGPDEKEAE